MNNTSYIGDGVYAIFDGYGILLHANDLNNPTDRIYLEPSVLKSLNLFDKNIQESLKKDNIAKKEKS